MRAECRYGRAAPSDAVHLRHVELVGDELLDDVGRELGEPG